MVDALNVRTCQSVKLFADELGPGGHKGFGAHNAGSVCTGANAVAKETEFKLFTLFQFCLGAKKSFGVGGWNKSVPLSLGVVGYGLRDIVEEMPFSKHEISAVNAFKAELGVVFGIGNSGVILFVGQNFDF